MKKLPYLLLIFSLLFSCHEAAKKPNILLFTGGKKIDRPNFLKVFEEMDHITYQEVIYPQANQMFLLNEIEEFDILIFYDLAKEIREEEKQAFLSLLQKGKNVLFLHHSLVSYQEWDEFEKIIGGRFYQSKNEADKLKHVQSTYRHHVDIPVSIVDKNHPVTKGMDDFVIHDEVYGKCKFLNIGKVLLKTDHPENNKVMAWTHQYFNSQIVYLQLGDDKFAYEDPHFRRLIQQSINWLSNYKP